MYLIKIILSILFILACTSLLSQEKQNKIPLLRWELSIGEGPFADLFYAFRKDPDFTAPGYTDLKGKNVNIGIINKYELKYFIKKHSAISIYYQQAQFKYLYGESRDPLGLWKELRVPIERHQFSLNYYKQFQTGINSTISIGTGFQIQIEKSSFPYYTANTNFNPPLITSINARPYWTYWEDWAIPLTVTQNWSINKNLKIGISLNTAYTAFIGVDGIAVIGNLCIPIGKVL